MPAGIDIPPYQILREIGRGGMGVVYLAWDVNLGRKVAVKVLPNVVPGRDETELERFIAGARAAAAIKHPALVTMHHAGLVDGVPYLVMEYIEGSNLAAVLHRSGPLTPGLSLAVINTVCEAVEALHRQEIVHRDIKPANVLVDLEGRLYITDFGLACRRPACGTAREDAGVAGTPAYMAPEAFDGTLSARSDVYSLGATAYELLTGSVPFTGSLAELRAQHADRPLPVEPLRARAVPPALIEVLERATHKNPLFRYKSAEHFRHAFAAALPGSPATERERLQFQKLAAGEQVGGPARLTLQNSPSTSYFETLAVMAAGKRQSQTTGQRSPPAGVNPPRSTLSTDVPCAQCRYNLRGLPAEGKCPECGTPLSASLRADRLMFAEPRWLRRLKLSNDLLYWTLPLWFVFQCAAGGLVDASSADRASGIWTVLFRMIWPALAVGGILLGTTPEPGQRLCEGVPSRLAASLAAILLLPVMGVHLVMENVARSASTVDWAAFSRAISLIVWLVAISSYLLYLSTLTARFPQQRLAARYRREGVVLLALALFSWVPDQVKAPAGAGFSEWRRWMMAATFILIVASLGGLWLAARGCRLMFKQALGEHVDLAGVWASPTKRGAVAPPQTPPLSAST